MTRDRTRAAKCKLVVTDALLACNTPACCGCPGCEATLAGESKDHILLKLGDNLAVSSMRTETEPRPMLEKVCAPACTPEPCVGDSQHNDGEGNCVGRRDDRQDGPQFKASHQDPACQPYVGKEVEEVEEETAPKQHQNGERQETPSQTPTPGAQLPDSFKQMRPITLMVLRLPRTLSQERLLSEWPVSQYQYDVLYAPFDRRQRRPSGCVVINFLTYKAAAEFYTQWHGRQFQASSGTKTARLEVVAAIRQGFEANMMHWKKTLRPVDRAGCLPVVYSGQLRQDFWEYADYVDMSVEDVSTNALCS